MLENLTQWVELMPAWLIAITGVVSASTAITALTPSTSDDKVVNAALKVLNFLSGNIFRNKNADDV